MPSPEKRFSLCTDKPGTTNFKVFGSISDCNFRSITAEKNFPDTSYYENFDTKSSKSFISNKIMKLKIMGEAFLVCPSHLSILILSICFEELF